MKHRGILTKLQVGDEIVFNPNPNQASISFRRQGVKIVFDDGSEHLGIYVPTLFSFEQFMKRFCELADIAISKVARDSGMNPEHFVCTVIRT